MARLQSNYTQFALPKLKSSFPSNLQVHLVVDATASRSMLDRNIAIDKLKNIGTHITTAEAIILNLLGGKNHPQFRQVQQLIRDLNPLNKSLL